MRINAFLPKLVLVLTIVLSGAACAGSDRGEQARRNTDTDTLVIYADTGEHRFDIELADDDEERRLGLMYRTELADDAGMLFDFGDPQPVSMWMKNTLISLDMAFIDEEGVIRRIAANTTPRSLDSIPSGANVIAVLEVNGGLLERLGVEEGDKVAHPIFQAD